MVSLFTEEATVSAEYADRANVFLRVGRCVTITNDCQDHAIELVDGKKLACGPIYNPGR